MDNFACSGHWFLLTQNTFRSPCHPLVAHLSKCFVVVVVVSFVVVWFGFGGRVGGVPFLCK